MTLYQKLDLTWKFAVLALAGWVLCCGTQVDGSFVSADVALDVVADGSSGGHIVKVRKEVEGEDETVSIIVDGEGLAEGLADLPEDLRAIVEKALDDVSIDIDRRSSNGEERKVVVIKKSVTIDD